MKFGLPLVENVLLPLGLTKAVTTNAGIHKAIHGPDITLVIGSEDSLGD